MKFPNKNVQKIALKVLKRNAFFAHHENILLAMLADDDMTVRRLGVNKILSRRGSITNFQIGYDVEEAPGNDDDSDNEVETAFQSSGSVRKFQVPKINENAKTYYKLIDLNLSNICEPSAIRNLADLEFLRAERLHLQHPCHNQAVERHIIKLVTEACSAVAGFERRDSLIRQQIRSRKLMKHFNTKIQFQS